MQIIRDGKVVEVAWWELDTCDIFLYLVMIPWFPVYCLFMLFDTFLKSRRETQDQDVGIKYQENPVNGVAGLVICLIVMITAIVVILEVILFGGNHE